MRDRVQIILAVLALVLGLAVWRTDYWISLLMTELSLKEAVAESVQTEGQVYRRFKGSATWFPLGSGHDQLSAVFENDRVATGANSTSTLDFKALGKIKILEESLVQVRLYGGKPLLLLQSGNVDLTQVISGLYVATPGGRPVELKEKKKSARKHESPPPPEQSDPQNAKAADRPTKNLASEIILEADSAQKLGIFPADGAYLFVATAQEILFSLNEICADQCQIAVQINPATPAVHRQFKAGEALQMSLPLPKSKETVRWNFSDSVHRQSGSFEVREYSEQEFADAIKAKKTVTVLF